MAENHPDFFVRVVAAIGEVETEMKRSGNWSSEPLPEEAFDFQQAFGQT